MSAEMERTVHVLQAGIDRQNELLERIAVAREASKPPTFEFMGMRVCSDCGNKRCPKAWTVGAICTGSNEPGQTPFPL